MADYKFTGKEPTPYENENVTILNEEMREIIQEALQIQEQCTKLQRFGLDEVQAGHEHTNAQRLAMEIGDFQVVVARLIASNTLDPEYIEKGRLKKEGQLMKYAKHRLTDSK